jgi:uncharacterized protein (DUF1330 family)
MGYLEVSEIGGMRFFQRGIEGPVVMLNLLRFRDVADYSDFPELVPDEPISGVEAYEIYKEHTAPFLAEAGGNVRFYGEGGHNLIGPDDERWDVVMLVRHASVEAFMAMASNQAYLAGLGHRTAALEDSRLIPVS